MLLTACTPAESIPKAYRIQPATRPQIDLFRAGYTQLMSRIDAKESEENVKGHLMDFLKETYYRDTHLVAPKGRTDFVIHTGKEATSPVGVLVEVKRPANKAEMVTRQNLNVKAFHEIILYYFQERQAGNNDIRYCVITNIYEWFIFDATLIDQIFYRNHHLLKEYKAWTSGQKVSKNNDLFYNEIIKPFLAALTDEISFSYLDLRDVQTVVADNNPANDTQLLPVYKLLSPTHLLKLPTATDSNKLNPAFYAELLHIIGLEEVKEDKGSKKIILPKPAGRRDEGSLLENTKTELQTANKLRHLTDPTAYGNTPDEQLFGAALELCITWVNRILFLKLLESQLIAYHRTPAGLPDTTFAFLNIGTLTDFDEIYKLFFRVLACKPNERAVSVQRKFGRVPYLNSSLFEITDLEDQTLSINGLDDSQTLPLFRNSVLSSNPAYTGMTELGTLTYLLAFLNAYDFASERSEQIQERNRPLINASVLGLIFEKINGYKDGSFYTPGFITEYMCRETIRRAVVQKFNDAKGWTHATFDDLANEKLNPAEANALINSLTICDPAVGSGHFLVSALNELIAIKSDLGILQDDTGKRLKNYTVSVLNDELLVLDDDSEPFQYRLQANNRPNAERQRVQKTLFHEKQTLIENCLFGVDINANSVKICRLRLWIELLKNAYYTDESGFADLETLPNIDINIKQGNSLLSKFSLTEDLTDVFKKQRFSLQTYRHAVLAYKNERSKDAKAELSKFIADIKSQFRETVQNRDPRRKKLAGLRGQLALLQNNVDMFGQPFKDPKQAEAQTSHTELQIKNLETELADVTGNRNGGPALYRGAFEWRFEFPEVLNDNGDFVGFDVVIGNPPYLRSREKFDDSMKKYFSTTYDTVSYQPDLYKIFIEKGSQLLKANGLLSYITPSVFLSNDNDSKIREFLITQFSIHFITKPNDHIFPEASVVTTLFLISKNKPESNNFFDILEFDKDSFKIVQKINQLSLNKNNYVINTQSKNTYSGVLQRIANFDSLITQFKVKNGIKVVKSLLFEHKIDSTFKPFLLGKDIFPYHFNHRSVYVHYIKSNENLYSNQRFRTPDIFEQPKVIVRQIPSNRLLAAFDNKNFYIDQTIYAIIDDNTNENKLKILLAIIGSKLMFFFFNNTLSDNKETFPKIKASHIESLPIPKIEIEDQQPFITLVNEILAQKAADPTADTSAAEADIDRLVYALYGLTEAEIALVEGR